MHVNHCFCSLYPRFNRGLEYICQKFHFDLYSAAQVACKISSESHSNLEKARFDFLFKIFVYKINFISIKFFPQHPKRELSQQIWIWFWQTKIKLLCAIFEVKIEKFYSMKFKYNLMVAELSWYLKLCD